MTWSTFYLVYACLLKLVCKHKTWETYFQDWQCHPYAGCYQFLFTKHECSTWKFPPFTQKTWWLHIVSDRITANLFIAEGVICLCTTYISHPNQIYQLSKLYLTLWFPMHNVVILKYETELSCLILILVSNPLFSFLVLLLICRYVESNPQYAECNVYLVKFRQLQVCWEQSCGIASF